VFNAWIKGRYKCRFDPERRLLSRDQAEKLINRSEGPQKAERRGEQAKSNLYGPTLFAILRWRHADEPG
jgi:hypothetical protein